MATVALGGGIRVVSVAAVTLLTLGGCYDSSLLPSRDVATASTIAGRSATGVGGNLGGAGGSGGRAGASGASGAGAGGAGVGGAGAGGTPAGGAGGSPGDVTVSTGPRCGDGRVDEGERCDTGIPEGLAGACPEACPSSDEPCSGQELSGTGCDATCQPLTYSCSDDDGCCPADCDASSDGDCSASCGDGMVQTDTGETCEPGTASPCPHEAECDDDLACTVDMLNGSEANCSASCGHTDITELVAGDGCCPAGASSNTDDDCPELCGNDVIEGDEECDGGDGCNDECEWTSTPEQRACLMDFAGDDECRRCKCIACTQLAVDCYASGNATRDMHCTAIEACERTQHCLGDPCYCGTSPTCGLPNGPCRTVIEAAAGSTSPFEVDAQSMDPATAIYRVSALATCSLTSCSDVCP